jgi:hypothetical protein
VAGARQDETVTVVSGNTLGHAQRILENLPETIELPQTTISTDGEIVFSWFKSEDRLEAILADDQHLTWVFRKNGEVSGGDVIDLGSGGSVEQFYHAVQEFYR